MATAHDLSALATSPDTDAGLEEGDLSLALAGAELLDLVDVQAALLVSDRILPVVSPRHVDTMLAEAASAIVQNSPYETVESWLWRRGRDLVARYRAALEVTASGESARTYRHPFRRAHPVVDPTVLRHATDRLASGDPILVGLAASVGLAEPPAREAEGLSADEATILTVVHGAVTELAAERQRRSVEHGAYDNIWRVP
ncbi:GPP34 family phosphoprotein [Streptomyces sp. SID5789]|uniref:GPP34 family phosphoprotein n=1 Tax=Streptomyces sp. SID5789 TaxID=2690310 RepID=UPI00137229B1|nr:GPP34 family phosphoprotein [Streptomyces sp. SID5789]MZE68812.1 GPP34 family phosphoprotein [Streptomyces sp. SID5789]